MLKPSVEPIVASDTLQYQCNQNKCRIVLTMLISKQINHLIGMYLNLMKIAKSSVNLLQLLSDVLVRGYGMNKMIPLQLRKHTKS